MVDIRQVVANNTYLTQIAEATDKLGNLIALAVDSELTMPLRIRANIPASLIVNLDNILVTNPEHARTRTIPPINGIIPVFTGGTITLPAASGGNITTSTGQSTLLNLSIGYYIKIGVNLNSSGQIIISLGTQSTVLASATIPQTAQGCRSVGYFSTYNSGGVIQSVANSSVVQYSSSMSSSVEGATFVKWGTTVVTTPYTIGNEDYIIPIDTTSLVSPLIVNLPAASALQKGRQIIIKDVGGNVSKTDKYASITPNGTDNIEGANAAIRFDCDRMSLTFVCDGAAWWIV